MMNEPKFLVVGTARAGTTALYSYLHQHPQVFLPGQKEPCFFCFTGENLNYKRGKFAFAVTEKEKYMKLFKNVKPGQISGDISTPYLYLHEQTIKNIQKFVSYSKELKIVIILRNPVERAYSQYLWKVRDGREELNFEEALKQEKRRMEENYSFDYFYAHRGLYFNQVKSYIENFKNVKIILFEDFKNSFENTMSGLCDFLNVDKDFHFTRKDHLNTSTVPRYAALNKMISTESKLKFRLLNYIPGNLRLSMKEQFNRFNSINRRPDPMSDSARKLLNSFYKEDIRKLQDLIGIHLSHWTNS